MRENQKLQFLLNRHSKDWRKSLSFKNNTMDLLFSFFSDHMELIYIVVLMIFLGIEIIGRVPSVLHTPLMSGANAIHGVVIIGAIIVMGKAEPENYVALIAGFLAVILGTLNVVGGFAVTDRMLEMFKKKKNNKEPL